MDKLLDYVLSLVVKHSSLPLYFPSFFSPSLSFFCSSLILISCSCLLLFPALFLFPCLFPHHPSPSLNSISTPLFLILFPFLPVSSSVSSPPFPLQSESYFHRLLFFSCRIKRLLMELQSLTSAHSLSYSTHKRTHDMTAHMHATGQTHRETCGQTD